MDSNFNHPLVAHKKNQEPVLFATPVLVVASGFWILDACICPVFGSTTGHHGQMTAEGLMQLVPSA